MVFNCSYRPALQNSRLLILIPGFPFSFFPFLLPPLLSSLLHSFLPSLLSAYAMLYVQESILLSLLIKSVFLLCLRLQLPFLNSDFCDCFSLSRQGSISIAEITDVQEWPKCLLKLGAASQLRKEVNAWFQSFYLLSSHSGISEKEVLGFPDFLKDNLNVHEFYQLLLLQSKSLL